MNFVVDASFALAWVFEDEKSARTETALDSLGQGAKALVPALWFWEIGNVLLSVERQKRATAAEVSQHLTVFQALPVEMDEAATAEAWRGARMLARKHSLTNYDAAYLELSLRRGLPLASLDSRLITAAKAEGVPLV